MAWIINCINQFHVDVINHPCPKLNDGSSNLFKHINQNISVRTGLKIYLNRRLTLKKKHTNWKLTLDVINQANCLLWRLCDAYMHQSTRMSLVQIRTCHLFGAKPLSASMLAYFQPDSLGRHQWNLNQNRAIFIHENAFTNVVWKFFFAINVQINMLHPIYHRSY